MKSTCTGNEISTGFHRFINPLSNRTGLSYSLTQERPNPKILTTSLILLNTALFTGKPQVARLESTT